MTTEQDMEELESRYTDAQLHLFADDIIGCTDMQRLGHIETDGDMPFGIVGTTLAIVRVNADKLTEGTDYRLPEPYVPIPFSHGDRLRIDIPYITLMVKDVDDNLISIIYACGDDPIRANDEESWYVEPVIEMSGSIEDLLSKEGFPMGFVPSMVMMAELLSEHREAFAELGVDAEHVMAMIYAPRARTLTYEDLATSLAHVRMSAWDRQYLNQLLENTQEPEAPAVPLAQYVKANVFRNHDFAAKAIEGMFQIATGAKQYTLTPRAGRSNESAVLTGSDEAFTKYLQSRGANREFLRAVVDTVQSLKEDPRAAQFVHEGRVWFTVNKITEEVMRTSAGTVEGNKNRAARDLVDRAIEAASSAQVKVVSPDGTASTVVYLLDAVRLPKVTYNGTEYEDVWGFSVSTETLAEYSRSRGRTYTYQLPNRNKPFTPDTAAIETYLSDVMNELRSKLYSVSKTGRVTRRRTKSFTVTKAWQGRDGAIFDLFSPTRELDPRQKDRLVSGFEDVLTDIVSEEAHGGRRGDMPLYVRAWSERAGGRGRGKGAYVNLHVEATSSFRAVRDGDSGHGRVDLKCGPEKAAPDNAAK